MSEIRKYQNAVDVIKTAILQSQARAARAVNQEQLALYYGIGHWNSYFHAFIYLNDQRLYPLQLVVRQIVVVGDLSDITQTGYVDPEMKIRLQLLANTIKYSIIVVTSAPLLIAYPFLQKYFVKGVMVGSIKM